MVRVFLISWIIGTAMLASPLASDTLKRFQIYRLADERTISIDDFVETLAKHQLVLVGERHSIASHHLGQLEVIKMLFSRGVPVSIGMEMMRQDSQDFIDAWIAGKLDEDEFQTIYRDNWNFPWPLYRPLFIFARENKIPIIGLNVSRGITRQVARGGFESLSAEERQKLPFVTCRVDDDYMAYIRQAYGAHGHGHMKFEHFCEAQLVWDKAMAVNALEQITRDPGRIMIILAGTGHARKGGIPRQLETLGNASYQVVLPEIPTDLDPEHISIKDADFLLQGL